MSSVGVEPGTTTRHSTTRRHRHKHGDKNPLHRFVLERFFDAVAREERTLRLVSNFDRRPLFH